MNAGQLGARQRRRGFGAGGTLQEGLDAWRGRGRQAARGSVVRGTFGGGGRRKQSGGWPAGQASPCGAEQQLAGRKDSRSQATQLGTHLHTALPQMRPHTAAQLSLQREQSQSRQPAEAGKGSRAPQQQCACIAYGVGGGCSSSRRRSIYQHTYRQGTQTPATQAPLR
jgi:hypothetical protein